MNSFLARLLLPCVLLTPGVATGEDRMPPEFTVEYILKKDQTEVGRMTRSLSRLADDRYQFESRSKTTGLISLFYKNSITETTAWRVRDGRFIADSYHYLRVKKGKQRKVDIDFDWDRDRIVTSVNDSSWTMPIRDAVYDKLLYQVAIMFDLSTGLPIDTYYIADGGRIKEYYFERLGEESITTPFGEMRTVKLSRQKQNRDEQTILWCAPALDYLPVRVDTYEEDGSVISAGISRISGLALETAD